MRAARPTYLILVLCTATSLVGGCGAFGPTTKEEVCESFDALDAQLLQGNGIIGNPLFHKAGDLASVADRYNGEPSLATDAKELRRIAKADATTGVELMNATQHIAELCGHPLGTGSILDGR